MKTMNDRRWTIYYGENKNIIVSGILAKTGERALQIAAKQYGNETGIVEMKSKPVYEDGIDLEFGENDADEVFAINIQGTSKDKVEELKRAIALMIGGPAVDFKYGEPDDGKELKRALEKNEAMVIGV